MSCCRLSLDIKKKVGGLYIYRDCGTIFRPKEIVELGRITNGQIQSIYGMMGCK